MKNTISNTIKQKKKKKNKKKKLRKNQIQTKIETCNKCIFQTLSCYKVEYCLCGQFDLGSVWIELILLKLKTENTVAKQFLNV